MEKSSKQYVEELIGAEYDLNNPCRECLIKPTCDDYCDAWRQYALSLFGMNPSTPIDFSLEICVKERFIMTDKDIGIVKED